MTTSTETYWGKLVNKKKKTDREILFQLDLSRVLELIEFEKYKQPPEVFLEIL